MDLPLSTLRVLREVADRQSFTAAGDVLGYTQSAVSRQVATAEREVGAQLFERKPAGVQPTPAGQVLLRAAARALEALESAEREITSPARPPAEVRVGCFALAGATLLPELLASLRDRRDRLTVVSREGPTPTLVRSLRAGSLDVAVLTERAPFRPPDGENPPLVVHDLLQTRLVLAVPAYGRLAGRHAVHVDELAEESWIGSPGSRDEPLLGVWPGLPYRARVRHTTRDWIVKSALVAAGAGVTTVPELLLPLLPPGVRAVRIDGAPEEVRRVVAAHVPEPPDTVPVVLEALRTAARRLHRS